jgi:hypothetical protein
MVLLWISLASGQTLADLETKYGKPLNVYSVSEHIWMTPDFAADGQICRLNFFHKRISSETNYLGTTLPIHELLGVLQELAPLNTRGARKQPFGATETSAAMAWTTFEYEKIRFSFWTTFAFGSLADMQAKGVPVGGRMPTATSQADDDFMAASAIPPVMVYVSWLDRQCAGK